MPAIDGSGLTFERVLENDPAVDALHAGDEPWTIEVVEDIQDRDGWAKDRRLWRIRQDDEHVAYAMLTFWNQPHPEPTDVSKASYYAILDLLILPSFRGKKDRVRKVSIARVIFEWIESRARAREDCVGMTLVVQEGNTHAVEVYKHFDFRVVRRVVEAWAVYLEMRRNF